MLKPVIDIVTCGVSPIELGFQSVESRLMRDHIPKSDRRPMCGRQSRPTLRQKHLPVLATGFQMLSNQESGERFTGRSPKEKRVRAERFAGNLFPKGTVQDANAPMKHGDLHPIMPALASPEFQLPVDRREWRPIGSLGNR